jgi:hypothetical protein
MPAAASDLDDPAASPKRKEPVNAPIRASLEREPDANGCARMRHGHPQRQRAAGETDQKESDGEERRDRLPLTT